PYKVDRLVGIIFCVEENVSYYFPCFNRKFKNLYSDKSNIKDLNPFLQCRDWNEQMCSVVSNAVDKVHKRETIQADVAFHEGLQKSR
ncbi:MAG: hypothetical protein J6K99_05875, partial [Peptococcaceae bacterium]|nr:hypothetical protein [Peptococcaceae bacterium]